MQTKWVRWEIFKCYTSVRDSPIPSRKLTEWIREMKRLLGQYSFMINYDVYVISENTAWWTGVHAPGTAFVPPTTSHSILVVAV